MWTASFVEPEWLRTLVKSQPKAAELLARSEDEQRQLGYFHTLREICQQPSSWLETGELMRSRSADLSTKLEGIRSLAFTGSGSSEYASECLCFALQDELGIPVRAVGGGGILAYGNRVFPMGRPALMVSLARSGDSPESVGAVAFMLASDPAVRHLALTCNPNGNLAKIYREDPRVTVIALDERTNDRGLVMTSSFTNLVLGARFLGLIDQPGRYRLICEQLSGIAANLLRESFGMLAQAAKAPFRRAVFLSSGAAAGAGREAALKMLEMTAGRVATLYETYLGLRHGPMSYVHDDTLVVSFLSSDPVLRRYESDLLAELNQKNLGLLRVLVGEDIPGELVREQDVVIHCKGIGELGDENAAVIFALVGQLLAFFRCLEEGLRPDSPSENGVINRVVQSFALHLPESSKS